jgi:hypothetical protein
MTRDERRKLLRRMAAALHRAELREKHHDDPPTYARLPEWAQMAYIKRADAALRVAERSKLLTRSMSAMFTAR